MESVISEKKNNFKDGDVDFIYVYFNEMKNAENDPNSHFHGNFTFDFICFRAFNLLLPFSTCFSPEVTPPHLLWSELFCTSENFPTHKKNFE